MQLTAFAIVKDEQFLTNHHLVIVDLHDSGGWDWNRGEPSSDNPAYYLRFCKSFYRMGGSLDYIRCDNRVFLAYILQKLGISPAVENNS